LCGLAFQIWNFRFKTDGVNNRSSSFTVQLDALPTRGPGTLLPTARNFTPTTANAVCFRRGPDTVENRIGQRPADPERHAIADSPEFCFASPASKLKVTRKALAAALFGERLMAADWLRRDGFRPPSNSPVPTPVVHASRANNVAQLVSKLDGTPTQLASTTFEIIDCDALYSIGGNSHVWHIRNVLNQCPRRLTLFDYLHGET